MGTLGSHRGLKSDRGSAAVEFAIIAPIFILITLFMIDAGRIFYVKTELLNASSQGAREESVGGSPAQVSAVAQAAGASAIAMANSIDTQINVAIDTPCPATLTPNTVQMGVVTASINFSWITPIALIQRFDPNSTRPGTILISETSQWLCTKE